MGSYAVGPMSRCPQNGLNGSNRPIYGQAAVQMHWKAEAPAIAPFSDLLDDLRKIIIGKEFQLTLNPV